MSDRWDLPWKKDVTEQAWWDEISEQTPEPQNAREKLKAETREAETMRSQVAANTEGTRE